LSIVTQVCLALWFRAFKVARDADFQRTDLRLSVEIGDLVAMKMSGTRWLVLNVIADTILAQNVETNYRSWMTKSAFEVISGNR